jgi:WD40 repeat protein
MLASGTADGIIVLWDMATHQPINQLAADQDFVDSVAFSPDGTMLASGSDDGTILFWDTATRQAISPPLKGPRKTVRKALRSVAFSPDGTMLASGTAEGPIIVWNTETAQKVHTWLAAGSEDLP